jgi:hypothetical protein
VFWCKARARQTYSKSQEDQGEAAGRVANLHPIYERGLSHSETGRTKSAGNGHFSQAQVPECVRTDTKPRRRRCPECRDRTVPGPSARAVKTVQRLLDVDISAQRSKHVDEFAGQRSDYVITLCDRARDSCPTFPGDPEQIHWRFDDPAAVQGSDDARYLAFRQVAAELGRRLGQLLIIIEKHSNQQTEGASRA